MVWVNERKSKAYDKDGKEIDCGLVNLNKKQANPSGYKKNERRRII